jgi:uncharacterized protein
MPTNVADGTSATFGHVRVRSEISAIPDISPKDSLLCYLSAPGRETSVRRSVRQCSETIVMGEAGGNCRRATCSASRSKICSLKPMTGFFRDGCCNTAPEDVGSHTVCDVITAEFLEFSKSRGNDLSTPVPESGFPGLKPGDRWCLCAPRWQEALEAKRAPRVVLRATHEGALTYCSLADLKRLAVDLA